MFVVQFKNYKSRIRNIGKAETQEQAFKIIQEYLQVRNYNPPYMRVWKRNNVIEIDVGGWYEMFYIKEKM